MRRPAPSPVDNNGFPRIPFGLPNLRRNVCPHFYMTGPRGPIPITAPHLLKALMRQDINVARCQLRGGVHLEQGYVSDICLSPRFNQCVFYEDELDPTAEPLDWPKVVMPTSTIWTTRDPRAPAGARPFRHAPGPRPDTRAASRAG